MLKVVGASWNKIRASTWIIGIVTVFGIIIVILGELGVFLSRTDDDGNWAATVYWNKESGFEIFFWGQGKKRDEVPKGAARAFFQSHINKTGWAVLDIETQSEYPDWVQAFGAGMLEGSLSWQMIDWQRHNVIESTCKTDEDLCEDIRDYLKDNKKWVDEMFYNRSDTYWHQINLFYLQLDGILKGFEQGVKRSRAQDVEEMTMEDLLWLNAVADIEDLKNKFLSDDDDDHSATSADESVLLKKLRRSISYLNGEQALPKSKSRNGHRNNLKCEVEDISLASTFIKLVVDKGKLYIAHNSAGYYSSMLKMLKHYQFPYRKSRRVSEIVPGRKITFSSYPGVIHSMDDFYVVQNEETQEELVITGVPLPVFNDELWLSTSVNKLLIGPRIMVANRLASNGQDWGRYAIKYSSGTGNKEWMVADFMKFKKLTQQTSDLYKRELGQVQGLLYIAEQIPGHFQIEDKTDMLISNTYWASYGLPFFENISKLSGVDAMYEDCGEFYSYTENPVAKIFLRDQGNATDMISVAKLMRSNFYKTDPISGKNPRYAVGSRGDIESEVQEPAPLGVTDTKIYSNEVTEPESVDNKEEVPDKAFPSSTFQIKAGPPYSDSWNVLNRTEETKQEDDDPEGNNLGPFIWPESKFSEDPHLGHPDKWDFEPIAIF
ncbi:UNVERIFIED_CONTAM: hypothetical protein PYX00_005573 [Menopon gallinae]|uniref:Phospholipase B-like n=1 Tax=Menopon gallinae TaxID=328185 RepID=A0AAW2HRY6_9NEOP